MRWGLPTDVLPRIEFHRRMSLICSDLLLQERPANRSLRSLSEAEIKVRCPYRRFFIGSFFQLMSNVVTSLRMFRQGMLLFQCPCCWGLKQDNFLNEVRLTIVREGGLPAGSQLIKDTPGLPFADFLSPSPLTGYCYRGKQIPWRILLLDFSFYVVVDKFCIVDIKDPNDLFVAWL